MCLYVCSPDRMLAALRAQRQLLRQSLEVVPPDFLRAIRDGATDAPPISTTLVSVEPLLHRLPYSERVRAALVQLDDAERSLL